MGHGARDLVSALLVDTVRLSPLAIPETWPESKANGRATSPGRFYSSLILKLVLAHVLRGYDCELLDNGKPQTFMWRTAVLPRTDLMMLMKPRGKEDLMV